MTRRVGVDAGPVADRPVGCQPSPAGQDWGRPAAAADRRRSPTGHFASVLDGAGHCCLDDRLLSPAGQGWTHSPTVDCRRRPLRIRCRCRWHRHYGTPADQGWAAGRAAAAAMLPWTIAGPPRRRVDPARVPLCCPVPAAPVVPPLSCRPGCRCRCPRRPVPPAVPPGRRDGPVWRLSAPVALPGTTHRARLSPPFQGQAGRAGLRPARGVSKDKAPCQTPAAGPPLWRFQRQPRRAGLGPASRPRGVSRGKSPC
jgi:hypothetical protein